MKNAKIKLFIFNPYSVIGGTELSLSRLINFFLKKKNYDITYICLNNSALKFYLKGKIQIIKLKKSRTLFTFLSLRKILREHNYNNFRKTVFISNQNYANVFSILSLYNFKKLKKIAIERTPLNELDTYENLSKFFKSFIIKFLIKLSYNKFDIVICISNYIAKGLKKLSNCKIKVIYNPSFFLKYKTFLKYRNIKIFLNVARLEKSKDHLTLLKSIKILKKKYDEKFKLIIIGHGKEKGNILKYIKDNFLKKNVKIINSRKPEKYYKISDLFILTSKYEGFGNVLIEAASHNLPIISTKSGGTIEILKNGKYGKLINTEDYKSLSKILSDFLNNKNKIKKIDVNHLKKFSHKNLIQYEKTIQRI